MMITLDTVRALVIKFLGMEKYYWILVVALLSCSHERNVTGENSRRRPNVLFIAVDDLRPMLGCYGDQIIKTPNMDRLATQGTLFERAYCNVPVCGASRASLLTGLRPTRNRFLGYDTWAQEDAPGISGLPAHFKQNGYYTVSLGKIFHHLNDLSDSWSEKPWRAAYIRPNGEESKSRHYLMYQNQLLDARPGKRGPAYEMAVVEDSAYFDGQMVKRAIAKLKQFSRKDTSFFLAVGFLKPHLPFNAPKKYWDLYPEEDVSLADNPFWPENAPRKGWYGTGELRKYHGIPAKGPMPDTLALKLVRAYRACVSYIDSLIGELMQALKETGLDENTIVILWGDHGYLLGEHKLWCKHITFNKPLQVPLLLSAPGFKTGQRTNRLVEYVDIYPTLCELAGIDKPDHLEGTSLVPLLQDPESPGKQYVFSRYKNMEAIKTDRYLYTEWIDSAGNVQDRMLYDHENDPEENTNIAQLDMHRALVKELSQKLAQETRQQSLGD